MAQYSKGDKFTGKYSDRWTAEIVSHPYVVVGTGIYYALQITNPSEDARIEITTEAGIGHAFVQDQPPFTPGYYRRKDEDNKAPAYWYAAPPSQVDYFEKHYERVRVSAPDKVTRTDAVPKSKYCNGTSGFGRT